MGWNKRQATIELDSRERDSLCESVLSAVIERTEKIPLASIRNVVSEAIKGDPDYHIMVGAHTYTCTHTHTHTQGLQLGPTEQSRYWIYWVPAQYVEAIKEIILGKWQI